MGTASQPAAKLGSMKGTAFRPDVFSIVYGTTEEAAEKLGSANLSVRLANFEVIICVTFCHPDRSEAQWTCGAPFRLATPESFAYPCSRDLRGPRSL
jgi:hypothetical protein